ncbi:hypothetical protein EK904_001254 [Melospiza melodia maxima]|nr:hypothetical protein EK904_001254 [Melospiza melodia maxima]
MAVWGKKERKKAVLLGSTKWDLVSSKTICECQKHKGQNARWEHWAPLTFCKHLCGAVHTTMCKVPIHWGSAGWCPKSLKVRTPNCAIQRAGDSIGPVCSPSICSLAKKISKRKHESCGLFSKGAHDINAELQATCTHCCLESNQPGAADSSLVLHGVAQGNGTQSLPWTTVKALSRPLVSPGSQFQNKIASAVFSSGDEQQEAVGIILSPLIVQMRCVQEAAEIAQVATLAGRTLDSIYTLVALPPTHSCSGTVSVALQLFYAQGGTMAFSIDHAVWRSLRSQDNWASVLHSSLETLEEDILFIKDSVVQAVGCLQNQKIIAPLTKFSKQHSKQDQGNTCNPILTCKHIPFQSTLSFKIQMAALSEILNIEIQTNTKSGHCLLKWVCSLRSWTKTAHTTAGRETEVQGVFQRLIVCSSVSGPALKPCWHGQQVQSWSDMAKTSPAEDWVRSSSLLASNVCISNLEIYKTFTCCFTAISSVIFPRPGSCKRKELQPFCTSAFLLKFICFGLLDDKL